MLYTTHLGIIKPAEQGWVLHDALDRRLVWFQGVNEFRLQQLGLLGLLIWLDSKEIRDILGGASRLDIDLVPGLGRRESERIVAGLCLTVVGS